MNKTTMIVVAAFLCSVPVAHADDDGVAPGFGDAGPYQNCEGGVCLVMGKENLDDYTYSGIRPYFTDWKGDQQYSVEYNPTTASNPPDGLTATSPTPSDGAGTNPVTAGTYQVATEDFWSPVFASNSYGFGDFSPNPNAPSDAASKIGWYGEMSGATVNKFTLGDITNLTMDHVGPHDASYWVFSTPTFTNTVVTVEGASADYYQSDGSEPVFLWNSLFHPGMEEAQVPTFLVPVEPFADAPDTATHDNDD